MVRFLRPLLLLAGLIAAMGTWWFLQHSAVLAQVMLSKSPPISLHEAQIILRQRGEKLAALYAAQVDVSPDARYAIFKGGAAGDLYDNGRVSLRLHAGEIVLDRQTNDLLVHGPLEITSSQGDRLRGEGARWDNATQRLVLSKDVWITMGSTQAHASRLTVDTSLQTLDLEGGVDVRFLVGRPSQ